MPSIGIDGASVAKRLAHLPKVAGSNLNENFSM